MTISRVTPYRFALIALITALALGIVDLAGTLSNPAPSVNLHNPAGHLAGLIASQSSAAPSLVRAGSDMARVTLHLFAGIEALLAVLFGVLLWLRATAPKRLSPLAALVLTGGPVLIALMLDSIAFHLLVAAMLGALLPVRRGLAWLAVHYFAGVGMDAWLIASSSQQFSDAAASALLGYFMLERLLLVPSFALAWLVRQERRTRQALAASHGELLATQSLLGDTVRASERTRIARDLHDAVGHHLTALNLHLDIASRQGAGPATASLETSRALARDLLAEVRVIVSAERDERPVDVRAALEALCSGIPAPAIRLAIDGELHITSPSAAHTLFCCVQEAITNTVRHACAGLIAIDITRCDDVIVASVADDGRGRAGSGEGNGLAGMRERLAQHGGSMTAGDAPGRGFRIDLRLPVAGAAA
ncbi:MAG: histidine kinase [Telluria sp.]